MVSQWAKRIIEFSKRPITYRSILISYIGVLIAFGAAFYVNEEGRDQACLLFERGHKADVDALRRSYKFLLNPEEFGIDKQSPIYVAVRVNLPRTEREAHRDTAPEFCDGGSVFHGELGRPEPDPVIPERPASLETPTDKPDALQPK